MFYYRVVTGHTRPTHDCHAAASPRVASDPPPAGARAFDQAMMEALLAHSSSAPAREAATAWLAAFETARAVGAREEEAAVRADEAWRRAAERVHLLPVGRAA